MKASGFVVGKAVLALTAFATGLLAPAAAVSAIVSSVEASVSGLEGSLQDAKTNFPTQAVSIFLSDASASAAMDLTLGTLRATASTASPGYATARASFTDTITVAGNVTGLMFGAIEMHVTGTLVPDLTDYSRHTSGSLYLAAVNPGLGGDQATDYFVPDCAPYIGFGPGNNCHQGTTVDYRARREFRISPEQRTLSISAYLDATTSSGGQANFGSTAVLSIELPEGLSFTSESGVLLVPEPQTWALMAVGLIAVGFYARRRGAGITNSGVPKRLGHRSGITPTE